MKSCLTLALTTSFLILLIFVNSEVHAQLTQLTNLPTLYITSNGPVDSKDIYRTGTLQVVGSNDTPGKYDGAIEIKGRGNSTWFYSKKPYKIKLASKYNLLGMPANERTWVLLANAKDNTLIRNAVTFKLSQFLGFAFTPAYRLVDVYLNGSYIGNYTLTDQVERGNNRVTIDKLESTTTSGPDLTGGYFLQAETYADEEPTHFRTHQGVAYAVKYPEDDQINPEQFNYIKDYVNEWEDKLYSAQALDPVNGYLPLNDRASQVNWYIACELTGNPDSFLSIYYYKKKNDPKFYYGPLWDFDAAYNNYTPHLGNTTYKRMSTEAYGNGLPLEMLKDPDFISAIKTRWNQLKDAGLKAHLDNSIVQLSQEIAASQAQNFTVWGYDNPSNIPNYNATPYSDFIQSLRTWSANRFEYLDQQFNDVIRQDKYYKLQNRTSGNYIDINNPTNKLIVQKNDDPSSLTQQWRFIPVVVNNITYYRIQNRGTETYLNSPDGNNQLNLQPSPSTDRQLWLPKGTIRNSLYGFTNLATGLTLANQSGLPGDGNPINQGTEQIDSQTKQQFTFIPFAEATAPLPVTVYAFKAERNNEGVKLSWKVSENVNGDKFILERTSDPAQSSTLNIGEVNLSSSLQTNYQFLDIAPQAGPNYYRLKSLDNDGSFKLSNYVYVQMPILENITISPIPADKNITLRLNSKEAVTTALIDFFDLSGKHIHRVEAHLKKGYNEYPINLTTMSQGLYQVRIETKGQVFTEKLVVMQQN